MLSIFIVLRLCFKLLIARSMLVILDLSAVSPMVNAGFAVMT